MMYRKPFLLSLLFSLLLAACVVGSISGPSSARPLDLLSYSMRMEGNPCAGFPGSILATGVLVADIPVDWQFDRASFSATFNGLPVSGDAVSPATCPVVIPSPAPAGFQRVCLATQQPYSMLPTDFALVTIAFRAGTASGSFPLQFWGGAATLPTTWCVQPTPTIYTVTVAPTSTGPAVPTLSPLALAIFGAALATLALSKLRGGPVSGRALR